MSAVSSQEKLRTQQRDLTDQIITRYEDGELWRFTINLALVVGGALLAALGKLGLISEAVDTGLQIVGLVMAFIGGVLVAIFDRKRTKLTSSARDSLDLAQEFLDEKAGLESQIAAAAELDRRRRYLLQAHQSMQEAVERVPQGTSIITVIETMLDAGANDLEGAIGFDPGEKWAFSIFQRVPSREGSKTEVMRRVAVAWADRSMERNGARDWKKKEGFTGVAWQRDDDVIEDDATKPEIAEQYPVPGAKVKPDDAKRYVSVAAIPIRVGPQDEMWGVVTATSDKAGRWRRVSTDPAEQNVQSVRVLSQLIAMQVVLRNA